MRWRWTLLCGLSLLPVGADNLRAEPPTTAPATQPATQPAAANDDQLPVVQANSIAGVVKLSVENKILHLNTELPVTDGWSRIQIADFPGKTEGDVRTLNGTEFRCISIRHDVPTTPDTTIIYMMASLQPGDVRLSVASEDSSTLRSVQYIQMPIAPENRTPDETPVRLLIDIDDTVNSRKIVKLRLTADNIVELRRKYPRETAEYLQPMLAALGQESVAFAVDERTAWQVLQGQVKADPKIDERLQTLIKQLDDDDYVTRETASAELEKLGEKAALPLLQMKRDKLSSEQNNRLDAFLTAYRPLSNEEAKRLATDVPFLLDCLYSSPEIRDLAMKQLAEVTGKPIKLDTKSTPTAWLAQVRTLRKELLPPPTTKPSP